MTSTFHKQYDLIKTASLTQALYPELVKEAFGETWLAKGLTWLAEKSLSSGWAERAAAGSVRNIIGSNAGKITNLAKSLESGTITSGKAFSKVWNSNTANTLAKTLDPLGAGSHLEQAKKLNAGFENGAANVTNRPLAGFSATQSKGMIAATETGTGTSREFARFKNIADRFNTVRKDQGLFNAGGDFLKNEFQNAKYYTKVKDNGVHLFERSAIGTVGNMAITTMPGQMAVGMAVGSSPTESAVDAAKWSLAPHLTGMYEGGKFVTENVTNLFKKKPKVNIEQGVNNVQ